MDLNRVTIIGRLGKDPEMRYTDSGKAVCSFSVATKSKKDGPTEWHAIVCWEKTAENAQKFLAKGSLVYVEGRIQTRTWEKDGHKNYKTEIVAYSFIALSKTGDAQSDDIGSQEPLPEEPPVVDDDNFLPF